MGFDTTRSGRFSRNLHKLTPALHGSKSPPRADANTIGLRDAVLSGWFQDATGELFQGFPVEPTDTVLDVGCGDGGHACFCARIGARLILVDADSAKVATAKARVVTQARQPVVAIVSDANPLPLDNASATKVIAAEVLEHVDDPRQFLDELVRVGMPGARYLLTVPDPIAEEVQTHLAPPAAFQKPNHIRIIQRDEFAELVNGSGLVVEQRAFYGFFWAMHHTLLWPCGADFDTPRHPVLDNWCETWEGLLGLPQGKQVQRLLDSVMPKSQIIVARKP